MKAALAALVVIAGAACSVAGPVVDRLPPPSPPTPDYSIGSIPCDAPLTCEDDFALDGGVSELRSLSDDIADQDDDAGSDGELDPDTIDWAGGRIELASETPLDVVRDEAPEAGTLIELRGPVTLRFENVARLERLRIAGSSPESRLVLDHVTALDLTLGDGDHPFAGRLDAKHAAFERASVSAAYLQLYSVAFVDSFVAAETFISRDGLLHNVVLELGEGTFAPSDLREVEIRSCDVLSFFESHLEDISISRCRSDVPTRLHQTKVVRGMLDGAFSADLSSLEAVRFGLRQDTSLIVWETRGSRLAFCDHADDLQLESTPQCSSCTEDAVQDRVCKLQDEERIKADSPQNFCNPIDDAPRCDEPFPDRLRPRFE